MTWADLTNNIYVVRPTLVIPSKGHGCYLINVLTGLHNSCSQFPIENAFSNQLVNKL